MLTEEEKEYVRSLKNIHLVHRLFKRPIEYRTGKYKMTLCGCGTPLEGHEFSRVRGRLRIKIREECDYCVKLYQPTAWISSDNIDQEIWEALYNPPIQVPAPEKLWDLAREMIFFLSPSNYATSRSPMPDHCKEAREAVYAGEYETAIQLYNKRLEGWGDMKDAWAGLAICCFFTGDVEAAMQYSGYVIDSDFRWPTDTIIKWQSFHGAMEHLLDNETLRLAVYA